MRNDGDKIGKLVCIVMIFVHDSGCKDSLGVGKHGRFFSGCNSSVRRKFSVDQLEPAPVKGNLGILRISSIRRVRECIGAIVFQLESQTEIQCLCGKLAGSWFIRVNILPGFDVEHAKFGSQHYRIVIGVVGRDIPIIIIGIIILFHRKFKCLG